MRKMTLGEFADILTLKNGFLLAGEEELANHYKQSQDNMNAFANSMNFLIENEEVFFYLSREIVDKALFVIGELKGIDKNNSHELNMMMPRLHGINNTDNELKKMRLVSYVEYESDLRNWELDLENLIRCMQYDAVLLYFLFEDVKNEELQNETNYKELMLSSINYLINTCPAIFNDERIRERLDIIFEFIKSNTFLKRNIKRYLRDTKKEYEELG